MFGAYGIDINQAMFAVALVRNGKTIAHIGTMMN